MPRQSSAGRVGDWGHNGTKPLPNKVEEKRKVCKQRSLSVIRMGDTFKQEKGHLGAAAIKKVPRPRGNRT